MKASDASMVRSVIERYFTKDQDESSLIEDLFDWKNVDVCLKDANGKIIYQKNRCSFPSDFSQTACDIIASKYFNRGQDEDSLCDVVDRLADFWSEALEDEGILDAREALIFRDEISYLIYNQMWAPNSPQWFNTGIVKYYRGAKNDDGLFYYDPQKEEVVPADENCFRTQASACYILSIEDKLIGKNSITDHYVNETKLFKAGSGCGTNFSPIRAKGESLSGGGTSSGLMSFLKGLDVNAGTIKSGGTTRRAAKMVIVDVDHPEIENFINWKVKEEEKAKVLIDAGYDGSIGGEAYSTVSGQNSNNSVRIPSYFMDGLDSTNHYLLHGRVDPEVNNYVLVDDIFNKIAEAAWACGDPGVQFSDTINKWNTCKASGEINASNPCGEFVFLDNTACNLSSINLEKFITKDKVNFDGLYHAIRLAQLAMEASIHWGEYPTEEIAENSYKFRPTGLGITGLAGALENLELAYDSKEARDWAAALCSFITVTSYEISSEMAEKVGPFEAYEINKESMLEVISEHTRNVGSINCFEDYRLWFLTDQTLNKWIEVGERQDTGFRNAQVTCIAPTGTISLAMDATSTGIEPYYSRKTTKKLADGSTIEQEIDAIKTADEIDPIDHVRMVAAIQPHISGAISKTVNMPSSATVEDIKSVFKHAYYMGCKSITIYRDGSKGTQVLETKEKGQLESIDHGEQTKEGKKSNKTDFSKYKNDDEYLLVAKNTLSEAGKNFKKEILDGYTLTRNKPEGIRVSKTHSAKIGDVQLYITVGFYQNGKMAEIFVNTDRQGEVINGLLGSLSKVISHLLQYGVEPEKISKILRCQKFEPAGLVERHPYIKMTSSISDLIAKVMEFETGNYSRIEIKPEETEKSSHEMIQEKHNGGFWDWMIDFKKWREQLSGRSDEGLDSMEEMLKEHNKSWCERNSEVLDHPEMNDYDEDGIPYWKKWGDENEVGNLSKSSNNGEKVYGEVCSNCGSSELIKSGTCKTCLVCGTTTGCG